MTKILIVEDNEMNLDMLSRRLRRRGYEICAAGDGAEGIEVAQREDPELILMDISLPVMDGYEATRILKANERTRHIPILGLSAHAMSGDAGKALAAGCDDYDTKPVDIKRLLGKIKALLEPEAGIVPAPPAGDGAPQGDPFHPPPPPPRPERLPEGRPAAPRFEAPATPPAAVGPERRVTDALQDLPDSRGPAADFSPHRGRVLVAGCPPERAKAVAEQLEELSYEAQLCGQAGSVTLWLAEGEWHGLILDPSSPFLDAPALIRKIRAHASTRDLRILLVSSVDSMEHAFRCIRVGADFFLPFPFSTHLLQVRLTAPRRT